MKGHCGGCLSEVPSHMGDDPTIAVQWSTVTMPQALAFKTRIIVNRKPVFCNPYLLFCRVVQYRTRQVLASCVLLCVIPRLCWVVRWPETSTHYLTGCVGRAPQNCCGLLDCAVLAQARPSQGHHPHRCEAGRAGVSYCQLYFLLMTVHW